MNEFFSESTPVARKPHRCEESGCRRTRDIAPGTRYVRIAGKFDGDFWTALLCTRCRRAHTRAWKRFNPHHEEGPPFGQLLYWLRETRLNGPAARVRPEAP